jgi:hypothetical protein
MDVTMSFRDTRPTHVNSRTGQYVRQRVGKRIFDLVAATEVISPSFS